MHGQNGLKHLSLHHWFVLSFQFMEFVDFVLVEVDKHISTGWRIGMHMENCAIRRSNSCKVESLPYGIQTNLVIQIRALVD